MRRILRWALFVLLASVALAVASVGMWLPVVVWHRFHPPRATALMHVRADEAAARGHEWTPRYEWVPLDRISANLEAAVLAAEDTRFYRHHGFDLEQIRSAIEARERGDRLRGASTITQQTVKNLYLSPRRDLLRKAREAALTVWMELWLPKRRILELYLNVVELGPGVFGAEAASRVYFSRPAARLTPSQAALLAATLPAPLDRNPGAPTSGLRRRQSLVLARMNRWFGTGRGGGEPAPGPARRPELRPSDPLELPTAPVDSAPETRPTPMDSVPALAPTPAEIDSVAATSGGPS
ncbi:MAG TPA: monofunctional biosynthetic peptidoglycan transglycosylase [Gemmatimonadota bacterium]|nr:monofunctional biosynthetic peptidoglycan transglycosylase [Gemmatimonadota bacterium]